MFPCTELYVLAYQPSGERAGDIRHRGKPLPTADWAVQNKAEHAIVNEIIEGVSRGLNAGTNLLDEAFRPETAALGMVAGAGHSVPTRVK